MAVLELGKSKREELPKAPNAHRQEKASEAEGRRLALSSWPTDWLRYYNMLQYYYTTTILYYYSTLLYSSLLSFLLFSSLLFYTVMYCTVLHCTALYCTVLTGHVADYTAGKAASLHRSDSQPGSGCIWRGY